MHRLVAPNVIGLCGSLVLECGVWDYCGTGELRAWSVKDTPGQRNSVCRSEPLVVITHRGVDCWLASPIPYKFGGFPER